MVVGSESRTHVLPIRWGAGRPASDDNQDTGVMALPVAGWPQSIPCRLAAIDDRELVVDFEKQSSIDMQKERPFLKGTRCLEEQAEVTAEQKAPSRSLTAEMLLKRN